MCVCVLSGETAPVAARDEDEIAAEDKVIWRAQTGCHGVIAPIVLIYLVSAPLSGADTAFGARTTIRRRSEPSVLGRIHVHQINFSICKCSLRPQISSSEPE